ncbi:tetrahydrofolate dehydrogenase/cyclohydrolase catalytic domain-containing protein [Amphritea sp. 2_MG-2023]|uniref:tetrahydrofolate dehydrogenase/cyclohydrolase catalytic domain-containing protein n=1 Tax=Amphritea TaxID=515417 RepID=UPI001C0660BC|nr:MULTISPECIES: tetrahydrofolate dehydrogenase/cyclohydrolase catalytic domain-containing protein [Amphritea]MBU2965105.1 bifunctional 5,10-methylene-tetrahydrofolate dehydrogenase/5,10-methylene-tetrahydrofolate cyclohydrolase [Amphritea atlantica]MDO6418890.1 tetrahydrofolate dehydrogenase/cyclohydrolase catalytic domain-containing protein [Amphritea sp. 2_MG-2023]
MSALILDGKALAKSREQQLHAAVKKFQDEGGLQPVLATILVGDDPSSATYVQMKVNACARVGMGSRFISLPASTTTDELLEKIDQLNNDAEVCGILLQHPVPEQIDERACFDAIAIEKDVDGVTTQGFGLMAMGEPAFGSATPAGIMTLLKHYDIALSGKHAVVLGRSPILGKPMAAMLLNANATVTICHSRTENLAALVAQADIVVGAVGQPELIKAEWIKDGAVVVDAGYHAGGVGDIEKTGLQARVAALTPVPGGVGPMTINALISHTLESAQRLELSSAQHSVIE